MHTDGTVNPIVTSTPVNDGAWHTAALVGDGLGQTLYLDGRPVRWAAGAIDPLYVFDYAGGGVFNNQHAWVNAPGGNTTTHASYFTGRISDIVFTAAALTPAQVHAAADQAVVHSDGTVYPSGSAWYSARTTMRFAGGTLTLTDATNPSQPILARYGVSGYPTAVMSLQANGDLVIYSDPSRTTVLWSTSPATTGKTGDSLLLGSDGNLTINDASGAVVWSSNTSH